MRNSKKIAIAAFLSFAVMGVAHSANAAGNAGVGLSFGAGFYQAVDNNKINGNNTNFGLNLGLDEGTSIGLYREDLNIETAEVIELSASGDVKIDSDISVDITEIRISRTIVPDLVDLSLGFGGASIKTTHRPGTVDPDGDGGVAELGNATVEREVPVIDITGRITAINTNGKKINAKLYVDLGYRFMDVRDIDILSATDGATANALSETALNDIKIDDLSGFYGNLGAAVNF